MKPQANHLYGPPTPLVTLHRNEGWAVINKPSGVVVHPGWADDDGGIVARAHEQWARKVYPVHRLDRGTSGALCLAFSSEVARGLSEKWSGPQCHKAYLALVRGHLPSRMLIDHPIPNKEGGPRVPAQTTVHPLATWERYGLVLARPHTGRLHQVRRHLKHISCPLIGDVNYGKGEHNRFFRERFSLNRLALHALGLRVPGLGDDEAFTDVYAPPGDSLLFCLQACGLADAIPSAPQLSEIFGAG